MNAGQGQAATGDDILAKAQAAIDERRFSEADALARSVLTSDPKRADAWLVLGLAAEGVGNFEAAQAHLGRVFEIHPDVQTTVCLASCLWRLGRLQEALTCIEKTRDDDERNPSLELVRATVLHGLGRYPEARAAAEDLLRVDPRSAPTIARLGATLMRLGLFDEARAAFLRAAALSPGFAHCSLIRVDRAAWDKLGVAAEGPSGDPHVVHEGADIRNSGFVVLVACDSVYLNRYGVAFVRSFAENAAKTAHLHLHVVDPDDAFPAFLDGLVRGAQLPSVRVTIEHTPDEFAEKLDARRTYYSCARLLHLPRLLRDYALPMVLLDIDAVIEHSLDELAALSGEHDVALIVRDPPDSPWLDVVANHIVVAPTADAARFAERLRNFVAGRCTANGLKWHLDQIALYCVLEMTRTYGEPIRIGSIPLLLQSRIWHIGNYYRYLLDDERFRRHAVPFGAEAAE